MGRKTREQNGNGSRSTLGYEAELWRMADTLRGSMDAAEYKHVVALSGIKDAERLLKEGGL